MTQILDFTHTNDSGEAAATAISPITNGEPAVAETFNRPGESLRNRTDVLRAEAVENRWVRDADRACYFELVGGEMAWPGEVSAPGGSKGGLPVAPGVLFLEAGASLFVYPATSPGAARGSVWEGAGVPSPSRFAKAQLEDALNPNREILVTSVLHQHQGGNEISITIREGTGIAVVGVTVSGNFNTANPAVLPGGTHVDVVYYPDANHRIADVVSALQAHAGASELIDVSYVGSDVDTFPAYPVGTTYLVGGLDAVIYKVSASVLDDFFNIPENLLDTGDTLALWFASTELRRQYVSEDAVSDVTSANLVNLSREPEKAAHCVPIARVVGTALVYASGFLVPAGVAVAALNCGAIATAALVGISPATGDLQDVVEAFDAVVAATAATVVTHTAQIAERLPVFTSYNAMLAGLSALNVVDLFVLDTYANNASWGTGVTITASGEIRDIATDGRYAIVLLATGTVVVYDYAGTSVATFSVVDYADDPGTLSFWPKPARIFADGERIYVVHNTSNTTMEVQAIAFTYAGVEVWRRLWDDAVDFHLYTAAMGPGRLYVSYVPFGGPIITAGISTADGVGTDSIAVVGGSVRAANNQVVAFGVGTSSFALADTALSSAGTISLGGEIHPPSVAVDNDNAYVLFYPAGAPDPRLDLRIYSLIIPQYLVAEGDSRRDPLDTAPSYTTFLADKDVIASGLGAYRRSDLRLSATTIARALVTEEADVRAVVSDNAHILTAYQSTGLTWHVHIAHKAIGAQIWRKVDATSTTGSWMSLPALPADMR